MRCILCGVCCYDHVISCAYSNSLLFLYYFYHPTTSCSCHFLAHEDTGMMSTLFIGPPDWVFRWEEHQPMFIGLMIGMVIASALMVVVLGRKTDAAEKAYQPVTMNEIKSKAMD